MSSDTELLQKIYDILLLIAEPQLAARDAKYRELIANIAGKSEKKRQALLFMDGKRTAAAIKTESGIDQGDLSRLISRLREAELLATDQKHPKLLVSLPPDFVSSMKTQAPDKPKK